jgi:hypothetical protein
LHFEGTSKQIKSRDRRQQPKADIESPTPQQITARASQAEQHKGQGQREGIERSEKGRNPDDMASRFNQKP